VPQKAGENMKHTKESIRETLAIANRCNGIDYGCKIVFKEDDKGFIAHVSDPVEEEIDDTVAGYFIRPSDKYEGLLMVRAVDDGFATWVHISAVPGAIFAILYT
jgi:hypothetical protein